MCSVLTSWAMPKKLASSARDDVSLNRKSVQGVRDEISYSGFVIDDEAKAITPSRISNLGRGRGQTMISLNPGLSEFLLAPTGCLQMVRSTIAIFPLRKGVSM